MVWSKNAPGDNKPRYLRKVGGIVFVTKQRKDANLDSIPDGWVVVEAKGHLVAKRK